MNTRFCNGHTIAPVVVKRNSLTALIPAIGAVFLAVPFGLAGTVNVDFGTPASGLENGYRGVITSNGSTWNRVTSAGAVDLVDSEGNPSRVDIQMDQVSGDSAAGIAGNDLQSDGVFANGATPVLRFTIRGLRGRNGNHVMAFITATTDRLKIDAKGENGQTRSVTVTGGTPGGYPLTRPDDYNMLEIRPEDGDVEVTVTNLDGNPALLGGLQIYGGLIGEYWRADLSISKRRHGGYRGGGLTFHGGSERQRISVSVGNRPLNVFVKLKNRGRTGTEFYLTGTKGSRKFRAGYFDAETGENLTGTFARTGRINPREASDIDPDDTIHLDARETRKFRVRIQPKSRFRRHTTATLEISSGSIFLTRRGLSDTVRARLNRK